MELGGSSPLTRGKRPSPRSRTLPRGLIPAHAGKTSSACGVGSGSRAHPRSRGENSARNSMRSGRLGSSPLTRGKPQRHCLGRVNLRLIPAHAGKTRQASLPRCVPGAHPRSRGENRSRECLRRRRVGSSPLTRGKPGASPQSPLRRRLIPAHAGKTVSPSSISSLTWAHPRSRGENLPTIEQVVVDEGSSPLTRGKLVVREQRASSLGLIPAHAGKTPRRGRPRAGTWAHPRSRGENGTSTTTRATVAGSSPLTRGKRSGVVRPSPRRGLIPAHAGKTFHTRTRD